MKRLLSLLLVLLTTQAFGVDLRSAGIKGATTSTPCAGCVGAKITGSSSSGSLSTNTRLNVGSIVLPAGGYLVVGSPRVYDTVSSTGTRTLLEIASDTSGTIQYSIYDTGEVANPSHDVTSPLSTFYSSTAGVTLYFNVYTAFSSGTPTADMSVAPYAIRIY